jgi:hypothetical protein
VKPCDLLEHTLTSRKDDLQAMRVDRLVRN